MTRFLKRWTTGGIVLLMVGAVGCSQHERSPTEAHDRRAGELLTVLETVRQGHLRRDAEMFLAGSDSAWLRIANGDIARRIHAVQEAAIRDYLASVRFESVRFVDPPLVRLSADGSMAWVAAAVDVCAETPDGMAAFRSAFLHVFERRGEEWIRVAEANTERASPAACGQGPGD